MVFDGDGQGEEGGGKRVQEQSMVRNQTLQTLIGEQENPHE